MNQPTALYDALTRFEGEYLSFPAFSRAQDEIESLLAMYRNAGVVRNLLVLGESGTGKTTLCRTFVERYPRSFLEERDVIPVLHVSIPPAATVAGTLQGMLTTLGDPSPSSGTVSAKIARAIKLAKGCSVELIFWDEAQHAYDRGKTYTQYMVGDCLKVIMDQIGAPAVMIGLPRTELLLRTNEQLRRRFTRRLQLALGQHESRKASEECLTLFTSLAPVLPMPLTRGDYTWREFGERLYAATDGRVAYVKALLSASIRLAIGQNLSQISPRELELAFTEEIWPEGLGYLNPFNECFEIRPLRKPGEPFEPSTPQMRDRVRGAHATA